MDNIAPNFGSIAHAILFLACDDIVETFYAKVVCVSYHIKSSCLLRFWFASSKHHIKARGSPLLFFVFNFSEGRNLKDLQNLRGNICRN